MFDEANFFFFEDTKLLHFEDYVAGLFQSLSFSISTGYTFTNCVGSFTSPG